MEIDVKIKEIGKITKDLINKGHQEVFVMKARDPKGLNEVTIKSASPFDGFKVDQLIGLQIKNPQKSLEEFNEEEEANKKKPGRPKKDA